MVEISDSLQLLFETTLREEDGRYVVSIPKELLENGSLSTEDSYRIALLTSSKQTRTNQAASPASDEGEPTTRGLTDTSDTPPSSGRIRMPGPPVEPGEVRSVTIDTLGDQGDGIAKVERGFIVIVPGTQPGDQVDVEITDVKKTVAFAEPVSEATVR